MAAPSCTDENLSRRRDPGRLGGAAFNAAFVLGLSWAPRGGKAVPATRYYSPPVYKNMCGVLRVIVHIRLRNVGLLASRGRWEGCRPWSFAEKYVVTLCFAAEFDQRSIKSGCIRLHAIFTGVGNSVVCVAPVMNPSQTVAVEQMTSLSLLMLFRAVNLGGQLPLGIA